MSRLLIVQPYLPLYRVPMFQALRAELEASDIQVTIVACMPEGQAARRGDAASLDPAHGILRQRSVSILGRTMHVRQVREHLALTRPDLIIVEQAVKNLEVYPLLARQSVRRGPRVGMWGQGRTFSTAQDPWSAAFKTWLTRRSDWFFAYTNEGADYVVSHGFAADRVTVVQNTIDDENLRRALRDVSDEELLEFMSTNGLIVDRTALFLGGVDRAKGMDFLVESAIRIRAKVPGFTLLIAGAGASEKWVRQRQAEGAPIVVLGRVDGAQKALALQAASLMMIPQWVGLVAVDSLVSGKPIVTTRHASHSPEFAYLEPGRNALISDHDLEAYAQTVVDLLADPRALAELQAQAKRASTRYSLASMVRRFADGIRAWRDSV